MLDPLRRRTVEIILLDADDLCRGTNEMILLDADNLRRGTDEMILFDADDLLPTLDLDLFLTRHCLSVCHIARIGTPRLAR